jgi:hypothetical protein
MSVATVQSALPPGASANASRVTGNHLAQSIVDRKNEMTQSLSRIAATQLAAIAFASVCLPVVAADRERERERVVVTNTTANPVPTTIVNGSLPVTGSDNATIVNPSLAVTGTVNANVVGTVPVSGSVAVTSLPALFVGGIPTHPFFGRIDGDGSQRAMGDVAGMIGVTSVLITNSTNTYQRINFFNAVASDPANCPNATATAIGGAFPYMYLNVEPLKTTQYTFPTPLVFTSVNSGGITCIGAGVPLGVELFVSGVLP